MIVDIYYYLRQD